MRVAIYGLPCAGKSTLISKMGLAVHPYGAEEDAVAERRFAFPSENGFDIVFMEQDAECFDVFAYLDTAPEIILERLGQSDEHRPYRDMTAEGIEAWRDFEVSSLRSECFARGKEFIILDPRFDCILEFLEGLLDGTILTSPEVSRMAADRILGSTDKHTIVLCDGDRTLADIDLTLSLDLPVLLDLRDAFYGDRYTTFQFWMVYKLYGTLPQLDEKIREAADKVPLNKPLLDDLSRIDSYRVVITAGLEDLWSLAIEKTDAFSMAIGTDAGAVRNISQFAKGYIARYLREAGREVIALGDNMVDYRMLLEADRGYVIAHLKKNAPLQSAVLNGSKLKQPSSNEIKFEGVEEVRSIYEDSD